MGSERGVKHDRGTCIVGDSGFRSRRSLGALGRIGAHDVSSDDTTQAKDGI